MKKNLTEAEMCKEAARYAMKETERLCKKAGLTKSKVLTRIMEGLDAKNDYGVDHRIRLKAAEMALPLVGLDKATKIEFPDENGKPQKISGGILTDMERATRLVYLMNQAAKRKKADGEKRSGKN